MQRYFLEVSYKGNNYSGIQKQDNAASIQSAIERAFQIYFRTGFEMTCSSRTDTDVHALQNFLHFDYEGKIDKNQLYHINAILPADIALKNIFAVAETAHCRFDALSREYWYYIYRKKNPFLLDRAHYFPYKLDMEKLQSAAAVVLKYTDFTTFSKRRSQVKTFECSIIKSQWKKQNDCYIYEVQANRFLRGMVRGLVGTMLLVGRDKMSLEEFNSVIENRDSSKADFSVPGHGLFLVVVNYPPHLLEQEGQSNSQLHS